MQQSSFKNTIYTVLIRDPMFGYFGYVQFFGRSVLGYFITLTTVGYSVGRLFHWPTTNLNSCFSTCSQISVTLVTHHIHYYVKCWHRRNKECLSICEKSIENSTKCEQCAKKNSAMNKCVWMHNFQILKPTGFFSFASQAHFKNN